jgi:hypothetical protein
MLTAKNMRSLTVALINYEICTNSHQKWTDSNGTVYCSHDNRHNVGTNNK